MIICLPFFNVKGSFMIEIFSTNIYIYIKSEYKYFKHVRVLIIAWLYVLTYMNLVEYSRGAWLK